MRVAYGLGFHATGDAAFGVSGAVVGRTGCTEWTRWSVPGIEVDEVFGRVPAEPSLQLCRESPFEVVKCV
jgi:hypothetical protein